jgi:hypothetical protein
MGGGGEASSDNWDSESDFSDDDIEGIRDITPPSVVHRQSIA